MVQNPLVFVHHVHGMGESYQSFHIGLFIFMPFFQGFPYQQKDDCLKPKTPGIFQTTCEAPSIGPLDGFTRPPMPFNPEKERLSGIQNAACGLGMRDIKLTKGTKVGS